MKIKDRAEKNRFKIMIQKIVLVLILRQSYQNLKNKKLLIITFILVNGKWLIEVERRILMDIVVMKNNIIGVAVWIVKKKVEDVLKD